MPYDEVMHKYKSGELHSGSKSGPTVTSRKQAIAIMLSEKKAAQAGKSEYKPHKVRSYWRGKGSSSGKQHWTECDKACAELFKQ